MTRHAQITAAALALGFGLATSVYAADSMKSGQGDQQKEEKSHNTGSDLSGGRDSHLGPAKDSAGSREGSMGCKGEMSNKMGREDQMNKPSKGTSGGMGQDPLEQRSGPSTSRDSGTGAGQ